MTRVRGRVRGRERLREYRDNTRDRLHTEQYARWRRSPIRPRTVMYESFSGNGMLCNPEAIFRALLAAPDMADLEHVWALDEIEKHHDAVAEFEAHPNVRFVEMRSPAYLKALATSKYLFNNATFPHEFAKRPEQIYVNTWHGVPLKRMGYDVPGGGPGSRNILRNLVNADYLLSANAFMTDRMYRHAFRLQGIFSGTVIEEGQPRIDRQLASEACPSRVLTRLESGGLAVNGRRVIVFAPTWKGSSFGEAHVNAAQLVSIVKELQSRVDSAKYIVLLKVHQVIYDAIRISGTGNDVLIPNDIPTNVVLGATDLLVTDYSSVLFDFLASGRPILHYVPDFVEYTRGRGLYLDEPDFFGPASHTIDELTEHILAAVGEGESDAPAPAWVDRYRDAVDTYAPHEDGQCSERVIDLVFRGADPSRFRLRTDFVGEKPRILIYLGGLISNGITASALNLLKNLDYERFDVSVLYHFSNGRDRAKNEGLIDERARIFARTGTYVASPRAVKAEKRLMSKGLPAKPSKAHRAFWHEEWQRLVGDSEFDHAVDFSGYGSFAPFLFSEATVGTKSLWLHSDLMAESQRETVGEKHLEDRLKAVFTSYRYFDRLVSVSPELNRVNSTKLAAFAEPQAFTFASNTIDHKRVLRMAGRNEDGTPRSVEHLAKSPPAFDPHNLASAVSTLLEYYDIKSVMTEVRSRFRVSGTPNRSDSVRTFVNVGRLSPEKNHARLINAFAQVHEKAPNTRLVVMGSGKLQGQLAALVESLGLEDYVSLAGQVENPYAIMAESDCFVMSSDYEGQPMVILEARTLGLPIVTTAFASVGDSVPIDAGIVVKKSDDALAEGMLRFLEGKVPGSPLDCEEFNRVAMEQFYAAIGASTGDRESPALEQVVDHAG